MGLYTKESSRRLGANDSIDYARDTYITPLEAAHETERIKKINACHGMAQS